MTCTQAIVASPCQPCGACCATSADWPRFSLESDADIALIPAELLAVSGSGMRCEGDRCLALLGEIGKATSCAIYAMRPLVCRDCLPGDDACELARQQHGLTPLPFP